MFERLLVPLDRTTLAEEAVAIALQIPSRHVRLLHVPSEAPSESAGRGAPPEAAPTRSVGKLRAWGLEFGSRGRAVEMAVAHGDPVDQIVRSSADADLIIMAIAAPGVPSRLHTKGIADHVAQRAAAPTVLIRGGRRAGADPLARIVVPLDGSARAEGALPIAAKFGAALGIPLHLIRVVSRATILVGREVWFTEANDYLTSLVRTLAGRGIVTTSDVRFGPVASSLRDTIEPNDLVVMAPRGRGGLCRWLLGSVAERLVAWVDAPVVLVRPGIPAGLIISAPPPEAGRRRPPQAAGTIIPTGDRPA